MKEQLQKLNKLIAIKIKQDIGDGLSRDELEFVNSVIREREVKEK